jgi:large subunit ribosomal protein L10
MIMVSSSVLTGNSAIFISEVANGPGKIIKDSVKKSAKPLLRTSMLKFYGDDQLDALATIKSREELIELIGLFGTSTELFLHFKINC